MLAILILSGLVLGTYLAWAAAGELARSPAWNRWGDALLVIGLAALGMALSLSR